jgi:hypothetical protein
VPRFREHSQNTADVRNRSLVAVYLRILVAYIGREVLTVVVMNVVIFQKIVALIFFLGFNVCWCLTTRFVEDRITGTPVRGTFVLYSHVCI